MNTFLKRENDEGFRRLQACIDQQEESHGKQHEELNLRLAEQQRRQEETAALQRKAHDEGIKLLFGVQSDLNNANVEIKRQQREIISLTGQLHICFQQINDLNNRGNRCTIL